MNHVNLRRTLSALAVVSLLSLAACGSSDEPGSGPWSFEDDIGSRIELDAAPERLVVQSSMAAALTDLGLGDKIVGTFGPLENSEGQVDSQVAGLDVDNVTDVTGAGAYGDIDLEKTAELEPDLVVTSAYLKDDLWYVNPATATKVKKLVPILVVSFDDKLLPQMLDSTERAAEALGGELDAASVAQAHDDFTAAAERVEAVGEQMDDRRILAGSPAQDVFYASNPKVSPDLTYWREELGLPIVAPDETDPGGYFQSLSWEKADQHPADVFRYDDRVGKAGLALLDDQPVFQTLEAAKQEAYVPWTSVAPPSRSADADIMNRLVDDLEKHL